MSSWKMLLLTLLCLPVYAAYDTGDQPAWVTPIKTNLSTAISNDPSDYLLVDRQLNYRQEQAQYFYQRSYRVNSYSAIENKGNIVMQYDANFQSLRIHKVDILRGGQRLEQLNTARMRETDLAGEYLMFNSSKEVTVFLPDLRIGDTVEYSFSVTGQNPVFDGNSSFFSALGWDIPVERVHIRILSDKVLNYKVTGSQQTINQPNPNEYVLDFNQPKRFPTDSQSPSWYSNTPFVQFSQYKDWSEVALWATNLFHYDQPLSAEMTKYLAKVDKLPSKREKLEELIRFVQDEIRYVGLELGQSSHQPHSPNEVFANRYGDCKDKTLLLQQLLLTIGVNSTPALVDSNDREHIANYLPTHAAFNHVILKIDFFGQEFWVDATQNYQSTDLFKLHQPDYGKTLLVNEGATELSNATPRDQDFGVVVNEEVSIIDYQSPATLTIESQYQGMNAERQRQKWAQQGVQQHAKEFLAYYSTMYPTIRQMKLPEVNDNRDKNVFTIVEHYVIPSFFKIDDNLDANYSWYADLIYNYFKSPQVKQRNAPLRLSHPLRIEHNLILNFPENVNYQIRDDKDQYETDFYTLSSNIDYDMRQLLVHNLFESKTKMVPLDSMDEYLGGLEKAQNFLYIEDSILDVGNRPGHLQMQQMVNRLDQILMESSYE
jgi:hypothetical protein